MNTDIPDLVTHLDPRSCGMTIQLGEQAAREINDLHRRRVAETMTTPPLIRLNKEALPRDWTTLPGSEGISFQRDVAVSPKSSLRLKVLVFRHRADLFRFWKRGLDRSEPHPSTQAVFNPLTVTVEDYSRTPRKLRRPPETRVDPRYFGVVAFVEGALTLEHIIHECTHAGFAYSRRVGGNHHWPDDDEEERVCYPAARLADAVIRSLHNGGMIYASHL